MFKKKRIEVVETLKCFKNEIKKLLKLFLVELTELFQTGS